ncbi:MAG TPA: hypothetical protein VNI77_00835 [Nitrososphaera sp.]|nr:hypothetical protein [Nitrososphaera sp.]
MATLAAPVIYQQNGIPPHPTPPHPTPPHQHEEPSDDLLTNKTEKMPEVNTLPARYPDASIGVDRSGRMAVDYQH